MASATQIPSPIIQNGTFCAYDAVKSFNPNKASFLQEGSHYQDAMGSEVRTISTSNTSAAEGPGRDTQADSSYIFGQYWFNVNKMYKESIDASGPTGGGSNGDKMDLAMDEDDGARYDSFGVRLPDFDRPLTKDGVVKPTGPMESIISLFNKERCSVEREFSPMGIVSADGKRFQLIFPPGDVGKKYIDRLYDTSPIMLMGFNRLRSRVEQLTVASWVLPTPCHVSPLAMAMGRERNSIPRFTDAISSACRLSLIREICITSDVTNKEHKEKCGIFYDKIRDHLNGIFYKKVDALCAKAAAYIADADKLDIRPFVMDVVREFARAMDDFSLSLVHALEWTICDLMIIPYKLRRYLMTPLMFPSARAVMTEDTFAILRTNLVNYVRDRNLFFCADYDQEKKMYTKIRDDAWNAMELDNPKIEDRLVCLGQWIKGTESAQKYGATCLFGLYNDWIDMHTLRQYMLILSTDPRKPFRDAEPAEIMEQGGEDIPEGMDIEDRDEEGEALDYVDPARDNDGVAEGEDQNQMEME